MRQRSARILGAEKGQLGKSVGEFHLGTVASLWGAGVAQALDRTGQIHDGAEDIFRRAPQKWRLAPSQ
jgi:hypothetical protein